MKTIALLLALVAFIGSAPGELAPPSPAATPPPSKRSRLTKYVPPKHATSGTRVDGDAGTRHGGTKLPALYVLAPDHTALTTKESPSLFWFQGGKSDAQLRVTVIEPRNPKPLLNVSMDKVDRRGIARVQLARYDVKLVPGTTYKWSVALVPDPKNRSQDVIASGAIQRIVPSDQLAAAVASASPDEKAAVYAANGIWHDALETLSDRINAARNSAELRRQRASLLRQVGLNEAAATDQP